MHCQATRVEVTVTKNKLQQCAENTVQLKASSRTGDQRRALTTIVLRGTGCPGAARRSRTPYSAAYIKKSGDQANGHQPEVCKVLFRLLGFISIFNSENLGLRMQTTLNRHASNWHRPAVSAEGRPRGRRAPVPSREPAPPPRPNRGHGPAVRSGPGQSERARKQGVGGASQGPHQGKPHPGATRPARTGSAQPDLGTRH